MSARRTRRKRKRSAIKTRRDHESRLEFVTWPLAVSSAQWYCCKCDPGFVEIPYHQRFGGYIELPLEMVAGIAGIVVFMGFLQLVIAFIFKLRGRQ